jgi:hypothetical protein
MKTLLISSLITLSSLSAFAKPIDLQPGSSIVVDGNVITCLGTPPDAVPTCAIKQDGYYYRVYAGEVVAESYHTFNEAIEGVKKMKSAGLCR